MLIKLISIFIGLFSFTFCLKSQAVTESEKHNLLEVVLDTQRKGNIKVLSCAPKMASIWYQGFWDELKENDLLENEDIIYMKNQSTEESQWNQLLTEKIQIIKNRRFGPFWKRNSWIVFNPVFNKEGNLALIFTHSSNRRSIYETCGLYSRSDKGWTFLKYIWGQIS